MWRKKNGEVVSKLLGNTKDSYYKTIVENMLVCNEVLECRMSLKVQFLQAHLNYFPQNLGDMSEEHGEHFHQQIKSTETQCQGRWDVSVMVDYCWCLKHDIRAVRLQKSQKKKIHALHRQVKSLF